MTDKLQDGIDNLTATQRVEAEYLLDGLFQDGRLAGVPNPDGEPQTPCSFCTDPAKESGPQPIKQLTTDDLREIAVKKAVTKSQAGDTTGSLEVDLSRTRFMVSAFPDHRWPVQLWLWIDQVMSGITPHRSDYRESMAKKQIMCARNTAMRAALESHDDFEWFIFIDQDVRPTDHTFKFLQLESQVKVCQVEMYNAQAWSIPTAFHEAIWCTSRTVLESIKPPWFQFEYTQDGCDLTTCICNSFRRKALDAGFSVAHGGWADHDKDGSWHY